MRFTKLQLERIAQEFWSKADQTHRSNFDILNAVPSVLPIDVVHLPALSLRTIESWFRDRHVHLELDADERIRHGFIILCEGVGFIFLNADDSLIDQRFTIAHEASHFLLDHRMPKERAVLEIGTDIKTVLNGASEPSVYHHVKALIKGIDIRPGSHLLEKNGSGSCRSWNNFNSENEADYLALELLAPRLNAIRDTLTGSKRLNYRQFVGSCREILRERYQLPSAIAEHYAIELGSSVTGGPSFLDKIML